MTPRAASVHPLSLISARVDGEITPGEARFLEAHLKTCSACQKKEAELKVSAAELAGLPVAPPPAGAIDRLRIRLRERSRDVPGPTPVLSPVATAEVRTTSRPWHRTTSGVSLATALATIAVVALLYSFRIREDHAEAPRPTSIRRAIPPPPASRPVAAAPKIDSPRPTPVARVADTPPPQIDLEPAAEDPPPSSAPLPEAAPPQTAELAELEELEERKPDEAATRLSPIYFRGESKRLTPEGRRIVESVAGLLREHPGALLEIHGHAGERRSMEKSLALGQKRALAVAHHLQELGIEPARLLSVSRPTDSAPADRVEFALRP